MLLERNPVFVVRVHTVDIYCTITQKYEVHMYISTHIHVYLVLHMYRMYEYEL